MLRLIGDGNSHYVVYYKTIFGVWLTFTGRYAENGSLSLSYLLLSFF